MKIETEFDLYCWIKLYFYREPDFAYGNTLWCKKWGSPLVALQEAEISCAKFAEVLANSLWEKGFRVDPKVDLREAEAEEHF